MKSSALACCGVCILTTSSALSLKTCPRHVFTRLRRARSPSSPVLRVWFTELKKNRHPNGCLFFFNGADDGARTRYLHLGKVALYQMSYIRIFFWCLRTESNHRHGDFQSPALPTELSGQKTSRTLRNKIRLVWRRRRVSNPRPPA